MMSAAIEATSWHAEWPTHVDGLAQVGVDGGTRNRLEALQLARSGNVEALNWESTVRLVAEMGDCVTWRGTYEHDEVHDRQRHDHKAEDRGRDHDDEKSRGHLKDALREELHVVRQKEVDRLDVL